MKRLIKWIAFLALIGVTLFVGSCAVVSYKRNLAFEQITDGTSEMQVISLFGDAPSVRESPTKVFSRYASSACASLHASNAFGTKTRSHWIWKRGHLRSMHVAA